MRIGGLGSVGLYQYRVAAVYGNPRSLQPVKKIGQETYRGDTTAVVEKVKRQSSLQIGKDDMSKRQETIDYRDVMEQMRTMTRFSADTIPMAAASMV